MLVSIRNTGSTYTRERNEKKFIMFYSEEQKKTKIFHMSADDTQNNAINLDSRAPTRENKAHKHLLKSRI